MDQRRHAAQVARAGALGGPDRDVLILFTDGEEQGLLGVQVFIRSRGDAASVSC